MKKIVSISIIIFLLFSLVVFAEGAMIENPIDHSSFESLFDAIIGWIIDIALVLAPLFIVYGGFLHITSAGDPNRSTQGKKLIIYAAIGLIVALLARSLIGILEDLVVI